MPTEPKFDYTFPYPSKRTPILASNCVATSHPLAAQAGLDMLRRGGNAIDAAVATAIALTVLEPTSNGIGADAFAIVWAGGGLHGLNASGKSPAAFDVSRFSGMSSIPTIGWGGVTTPGAVSAWVELAERFGSLPFETLFEPAIHYAREGFLVPPHIAYYWDRGAQTYTGPEQAAWRDTFIPMGSAPRAGQRATMPDHADTLEAIAGSKGDAFYNGELAAKIEAAAISQGGFLRAADLAAHESEWVRPIAIDYRGWRLHEIPPNGQGLAALIALGILRHFDLASFGADSPASLHLQIEAMKIAFADAHRYIADPMFMTVSTKSLLAADFLAARAALIDPNRAQDFKHGQPKPGGTVYLTTADADGNMVSYIQSNYTGFGSGVVIPGTGIGLQNRGCCFTLQEGHPNQAAPNKRPYHTIIPGFVTREENGVEVPVMSFGVMGGLMQPQGHVQVLIRIADYAQNPQAALDAPRWRISEGLDVSFEPGLDESVYAALRALGHDLSITPAPGASHGRGQAVYVLDHGYLAASDMRCDGQAVGF